jgi:hypothetical protein
VTGRIFVRTGAICVMTGLTADRIAATFAPTAEIYAKIFATATTGMLVTTGVTFAATGAT